METMRHKLQAQMEQNLTESRPHEENAQKSTMDVVAKLESLMQQFNATCLMWESGAAAGTEHLSNSIDVHLQAQNLRVDEIFNFVHEACKIATDNAKMLWDLMIAIENLGDNFQQMKEKMLQWDEPEQPMCMEEERIYNENVSQLL